MSTWVLIILGQSDSQEICKALQRSPFIKNSNQLNPCIKSLKHSKYFLLSFMNHTTFFSNFCKSKILRVSGATIVSELWQLRPFYYTKNGSQLPQFWNNCGRMVGPLLKRGTWAVSHCKSGISVAPLGDSLDDFTPALQKAIRTNIDCDGPFIGWKMESIIFQYSIIHFFRWAWIPLWKGKKRLMLFLFLDFAWGGEDYLTFLLWCLLDN